MTIKNASIRLIVGLGNPGARYDDTRHNAGFWFVDELARQHGALFRSEPKFHGDICRISIQGNEVWLLKPGTFMNRSGQAIAALARFYKIAIPQVLVAHDELDIPVGTARFKQGGGHGGHNGLRDTIAHLSGKDFWRLRIGIDHPGHKEQVVDYVLHAPSKVERQQMDDVIYEACKATELMVAGDTNIAMNRLHSLKF